MGAEILNLGDLERIIAGFIYQPQELISSHSVISPTLHLILGISFLLMLIASHHFNASNYGKSGKRRTERVEVLPNLGIQKDQTFIPIETVEDVVIVEHIPNLWRIEFLLIVKCKLRNGDDGFDSVKRFEFDGATNQKPGNEKGSAKYKSVIVPLIETNGAGIRFEDIKRDYDEIHSTFQLPQVIDGPV